MPRYFAWIDDIDLSRPYFATVEADKEDDALRRLAEAAVEDTKRRQPDRAHLACVVGAALPEFYRRTGHARRLDGESVDLTDELR